MTLDRQSSTSTLSSIIVKDLARPRIGKDERSIELGLLVGAIPCKTCARTTHAWAKNERMDGKVKHGPRRFGRDVVVRSRQVEQMLEAEAAVASARRLHRATLEIRDGYANDRSRPGTAYRSSDERSRRRAGQAHHTAGAASDVLLCVHNRVCRKIWGGSCSGSRV